MSGRTASIPILENAQLVVSSRNVHLDIDLVCGGQAFFWLNRQGHFDFIQVLSVHDAKSSAKGIRIDFLDDAALVPVLKRSFIDQEPGLTRWVASILACCCGLVMEVNEMCACGAYGFPRYPVFKHYLNGDQLRWIYDSSQARGPLAWVRATASSPYTAVFGLLRKIPELAQSSRQRRLLSGKH